MNKPRMSDKERREKEYKEAITIFAAIATSVLALGVFYENIDILRSLWDNSVSLRLIDATAYIGFWVLMFGTAVVIATIMFFIVTSIFPNVIPWIEKIGEKLRKN